MKLAVICLVGPLDRFGYQNTYAVALESFSIFADIVYLVSSTRNKANVDKIKVQFPEVVYISNSETWYKLDENGQEIFDIYQWNMNLEIGFRHALQAGVDAALWVTINEYIPEQAVGRIYAKIERMLAEKMPFDWTYRRFQLGSRLLEPDLCAPYILNLQIPDTYKVKFDWIETPQGEKIDCMWNGTFSKFSDEAIVDCPMEMTLDDLRDKMNFTRSYAQLNPNAPKEFTKITHIENYYFPKFLKLEITKDSLDRFGNMVTKNHQSDFVSHYILRNYLDPWRMLNKVLAGRYRWLLNLSVSVKKLLFAWRKKLIANAHARYCRFFKI